MNTYFSVLKTFAKPRMVIILLFAFLGVAFAATFSSLPFSVASIKEVSNGYGILDMLPFYDAKLAYEHIASYTAQAVGRYDILLMGDSFLFVPIYVLFFALGITHAAKLLFRESVPRFLSLLMIVPFTAGIFDLVENGFVAFLIHSYPVRYDTLAALSGFVTAIKSGLTVISVLAVMLLYAAVAVRYVRSAVGRNS